MRRICFAIPFAVAAFAQAPRPAFEVASVKPASQKNDPMFARLAGMVPLSLRPADPGRLRITNRSLRAIVAAAWNVPSAQVSGPSWMEETFVDIEARIPEGQSSKIAEMLQVLLEERFGLELHRESRIVSGYELVVAKGGSKLEPAQAEDDLTPLDPEERKKRVRGLMNERGTEASDGKSAYRFVEFLRRQLDHAGVRG